MTETDGDDIGLLPQDFGAARADTVTRLDPDASVVDLARTVGGDAVLNEGVQPPQMLELQTPEKKIDAGTKQLQEQALQSVLRADITSPAWTR